MPLFFFQRDFANAWRGVSGPSMPRRTCPDPPMAAASKGRPKTMKTPWSREANPVLFFTFGRRNRKILSLQMAALSEVGRNAAGTVNYRVPIVELAGVYFFVFRTMSYGDAALGLDSPNRVLCSPWHRPPGPGWSMLVSAKKTHISARFLFFSLGSKTNLLPAGLIGIIFTGILPGSTFFCS